MQLKTALDSNYKAIEVRWPLMFFSGRVCKLVLWGKLMESKLDFSLSGFLKILDEMLFYLVHQNNLCSPSKRKKKKKRKRWLFTKQGKQTKAEYRVAVKMIYQLNPLFHEIKIQRIVGPKLRSYGQTWNKYRRIDFDEKTNT